MEHTDTTNDMAKVNICGLGSVERLVFLGHFTHILIFFNLGTYRWNDGRCYKGGFYADKRHGKGNYVWPDGASYVGEFRDGQHEGQGTYKFAGESSCDLLRVSYGQIIIHHSFCLDGSIYEGEWKQGQYHGEGKCVWSDGRIYVSLCTFMIMTLNLNSNIDLNPFGL
jgi:hypothetical protein